MAAIMLISQFSPMGVYAASDDTGIEIVSEEAVEETGEESTVEAASEDAMDEASVEESAADEVTANDADSEDTADADSEEDAAVSDTEADSEDDETASDEEAADPEDELTEEEIEEDLEEVEFYDEEVVEVEDEEPERLGSVSVEPIDGIYTIEPHFNETFTLEMVVTQDDDEAYTYEWYEDGNRKYGTKMDSTTTTLTVEDGVDRYTPYYFYVIDSGDKVVDYTTIYVYPTNDLEAYVKDDENKARSANLSVPYGESVTLSVVASAYDDENITYQWYGPDGKDEEAKDPDYTIDKVTDKVTWYCVVNDGYGSEQVWFYITVDNSFVAYPEGEEETATYKNVNVLVGDDVTLKVIAESSEGDLTYEWGSYYASGVLGDKASLELTDVTEATSYYCHVSDQFGNSKYIYFYIQLDNEFSIKAYVNDEEKEVPGSSYTNIEVKEDAGTKVELKVEGSAHEDSEMKYQWSVRSLNSNGYTTIEDATGKTYTPEASGYYRCMVSDGYSNNSLTVTFYVVFDNDFKAYPDGEEEDAFSTTIAAEVGSEAVLKVAVSGKDTTDVTYKWTNDSNDDLSNETGKSLTISEVSKKEVYYCTVTDKYGTSRRITFNVIVDNSFVAYPEGEDETATSKDVTVLAGDDATLKVIASSTDKSITYQWKKYDSDNWKWVDLEEETTESLKLEKVKAAANYRCLVSDQYGNKKEIAFTVHVDNKFNAYPEGTEPGTGYVSINADPGDTVELKVVVEAHDDSQMKYEWHGNGIIEGAEKASYSVTKSGSYYCTVSDGYGNRKYVNFDVKIDNAFKAYPYGEDEDAASTTIAVKKGADAELKVVTSGNDLTGVTYLWESNDQQEDLSANTGSSLTVKNITEKKVYHCTVNDKYGSSSRYITFNVIVENGFDAYPAGAKTGITTVDHTVKFGQDITLEVIATATDKSLTYEWDRNYDALEETSGKLVLTGVKASGTYHCKVSDQFNNSKTLTFNVNADNEFVAHPDGVNEDTNILYMTVLGSETPAALKVVTGALDDSKLSVEWYSGYHYSYGYGGTKLEETGTTLSVSESGTYTCYVTDGYESSKCIYFYVTVDNGFAAYPEGCEKDSSEADIAVAAKGDTATLKVAVDALDKSKITYAWSGSTAVSSETGASVEVAVDKKAVYRCTVSDPYGNSKTVTFNVSVNSALTAALMLNGENVTDTDSDGVVTVKSTDKLELKMVADAENKEGLKYQWTNNGVVAGSSDTLVYEDLSKTIPGTISCTVTDQYGNTVTKSIEIVIDNAFYAYPAGSESKESYGTIVTVKAGGNDTIEVTAEAMAGELHYSWSGGTSDTNKLPVSKSGTYTCTVRDDYGHSKSVVFGVTADNALDAYPEGAVNGLSITKNVTANEAFTMKAFATANDKESISYKWTKGSARNTVIGKTAELSVGGIDKNTTYYCVVSDTYGNSKTLTFNMVVFDNEFRAWASGYDASSTSVYIYRGDDVELKVEVSGKDTEGVTYSWRRGYGSSTIAGETTDTLKLSSVTEQNYYYCDVKDAYGNSQSVYFYISFNSKYQVYAGDEDVTDATVNVKPGDDAVLKVRVVSEEELQLKYYWSKNGRTISGTTATQTISAKDLKNGDRYSCMVKDSNGNQTQVSFAISVDNGFSAYVAGTEETTATIKALAGATVELAVDAKADDGKLTYSWKKDSETISETSAVLKDTADKNADYSCTVTDSYGHSTLITFNVNVRNRFTVHPEGTKLDTAYITVPAGKDTVLKVEAEGTDLKDVVYHWAKYNPYTSNYDLLDGNKESLTLTAVKTAAQYRCVVTDAYGNSSTVYFNVEADNQFVVKAACDTDQTVAPNSDVKLSVSVSASDKEGITYQWYKGAPYGTDARINGVDGDAFTVKGLTESTYYYCRVEDAYGNSEFVTFRLTVDNAFDAYAAGYEVKETYAYIYVDYGKSATLEVAVEAKDDSKVTYSWSKSWTTGYSAKDSKYVLDKVTKAETYRCTVSDGYGNSKTIYFYVQVENSLSLKADGDNYVTAEYGKPLTLAVTAEANDADHLVFDWGGAKGTEKVDGTKASLTLDAVKKSGDYVCTVRDQYGNSRQVTFYVKVENNLKATADKSEVTVEYGKDATLKVSVTANETKGITYAWSGSEYDKEAGYNKNIVLRDADEAQLTVKNVCKTARYTCIVTDAFGNRQTVEFTVAIDNKLDVQLNDQTVKYGDSATLSATVSAGNKEGITYEWFSSERVSDSYRIIGEKESSLKVGSVKVTRTYTIKATDIYGNTATASATVNVDNGLTIAVDGDAEFVAAQGDKVTMKVTATAASGNITYTWNKYYYYAETDRWSSYGEVANANKNSYTSTVYTTTKFVCTATDDFNNRKSVEFVIRIKGDEPIAVTGVTLDKGELILAVGDTATLTETVAPQGADNRKVTWTSSDTAVATVDEKGNVKAVAAGTAIVTVKTEDGGFTATCEVTVEEQLTPVTGVTLDKKTLEMETGDKAVLTATVAPEGASNKKVSWSSDKADVAKVDEKGNVTAVTAGTAKITVTTEDGEFTDTCEVTVTAKEVPVEGVSLNKNKLSLVIGDKYTLAAAVKPMDASNQNVSWTTSDEAVATVNENGEVIAVAAGKATITVTTEDGEQKAVCEVTVTEEAVALTGITVDQEEVTLKEGETATLIVSMVPEDATEQKVVFSSSDGAVASVDQDGTITAVAAGKATITVKTEDEAFSATCEVTVEAATTVTSVSLNEVKLELVVGKTAQLVATVEPEDAQNKEVTWTIDKPAVATVDENGKVTAVAAGKATITVTTVDGELTATCEVTVNKKTEISGNTFSLEQAAKGVPVINNSDYTLKIERNEKGAIVSATIYGPDDKVATEIDSYIANIVTEYDTDGKTPKTFYSLVFTNGQWDIKYDSGTKGAYKYLGVEYFVAGGVVNQNANGLIYTGADGWRFLAAGHVVTGHKGLVMYANEWFWIDDEGRCDDTYAAIVKWNGANFLVHGGRLRTDYTGFTYDPQNTKVWYHITNGQVWGEGEITDISIEGGEITRNCVNGAVVG